MLAPSPQLQAHWKRHHVQFSVSIPIGNVSTEIVVPYAETESLLTSQPKTRAQQEIKCLWKESDWKPILSAPNIPSNNCDLLERHLKYSEDGKGT